MTHGRHSGQKKNKWNRRNVRNDSQIALFLYRKTNLKEIMGNSWTKRFQYKRKSFYVLCQFKKKKIKTILVWSRFFQAMQFTHTHWNISHVILVNKLINLNFFVYALLVMNYILSRWHLRMKITKWERKRDAQNRDDQSIKVWIEIIRNDRIAEKSQESMC